MMTFREFIKILREKGIEDTDEIRWIDITGSETILVNRQEINHNTFIVEVYDEGV